MNWFLTVDTVTCSLLVHSLWQSALLCIAARVADRLLPSSTVQQSYQIHSLALVVCLMVVPVTFHLLRTIGDSEVVAQQTQASAVRDLAIESIVVPPVISQEIDGADRSQVINGAASYTTDRWLPITPWIVMVYLLGLSFMLARLGYGVARNQQLRRKAIPIASGPILESLQRRCQPMNLRRTPQLAQADSVAVPRLLGIVRPIILLPSAAVTGLSVAEMEMILVHELAHLRRSDIWVNLIQRFVESILFFNPAIWILSRRVSRLREYCCDDAACNVTSCKPAHYARLLIRIAESAVGQRWSGELNSLAAAGGSPSELRRRIARMLGEPIDQPLRLTPRGALLTAFAMLIFSLGPSAWPVQGQTEPDQAELADDSLPKSQMTRRFDNGAHVELLGIGYHDTKKQQPWWDDSGQHLVGFSSSWKVPSGSMVLTPRCAGLRFVYTPAPNTPM